jgi:hypothetical protein
MERDGSEKLNIDVKFAFPYPLEGFFAGYQARG